MAHPTNGLFYMPGACLHCYSASSTLKLCSACEIANYCDKTCQKAHWTEHKEICKLLQKFKIPYFNLLKKISKIPSWNACPSYILNAILDIISQVKDCNPGDNLVFPRICQTCGENDRSKLTACPECFNVFYCSLDHFKSRLHSLLCSSSQLFREYLAFKAANPSLPSIIDGNNYDFWKLGWDFTTFIQDQVDNNIVEVGKLAFFNNVLTYPNSILYAKNKRNLFIYYIKSIDEFVMHVMGIPLYFDENDILKWEHYLLRFLPNCRNMRLVFIELKAKDNNCKDQYIIKSGKFLHIPFIFEAICMPYEDYLKSKFYVKPSFRVIFNYHNVIDHGLLTSILMFRDEQKIPLIIGTTTEAHALDAEIYLKYKNMKFLLNVKRNPFSSFVRFPKPFAEFGSTTLGDIKENNFIYVNKCLLAVI